MITLAVELTQEQYDRYKAAFKALHEMAQDPTDEQLIAQLKREASAITYAGEVSAAGAAQADWSF